MMLVLDRDNLLLVGGTGDVIQPSDGVAAIGSGGSYALAAARALAAHTKLAPAAIVRTALEIAGDICVYTNRNIEVEEV
jgi:ATP-dependent HslUV protease subunit HslV